MITSIARKTIPFNGRMAQISDRINTIHAVQHLQIAEIGINTTKYSKSEQKFHNRKYDSAAGAVKLF